MFSAPTLEGILDRLASSTEHADWCQRVHRELLQKSPTALKVTFRHLQQAAHRDLRSVLMTDYRIACGCLDGHDFYEGVRAALVDKDNAPSWTPPGVDSVTSELLESHFAHRGDDEMILPTREEMQAARV
jgi:enoyl-CoA hydratase